MKFFAYARKLINTGEELAYQVFRIINSNKLKLIASYSHDMLNGLVGFEIENPQFNIATKKFA
jgi:hypothetical protein